MGLLSNSRYRSMCNCAVGEVSTTRVYKKTKYKKYRYKHVDVIRTWREITPDKEGLCPECGYYPLEVPYDRVRKNVLGVQAGMGTRKRSKRES